MPVSPEARRAFRNKVRELLRQADNLSDDAVRRAMELLETTRRTIRDRLLQVPAEGFDARHYRALRDAADRAIADLVRRYRDQLPGLLETAHELGIDLAEESLRAMGMTALELGSGLVPRQVLEVLQGYSADLITNLGNEARRRINGILAQATLGTVSQAEAIRMIAAELPEASVFRTVAGRAEAIYRTEVNRTLSVAAQARMSQMADRLPKLKKRWVAFLDGRTRPTHAEAHGQVVGARERFVVGGHLARFPRDPVLPAGESVNCRCFALPELDDEVFDSLRSPAAASL